MLHVRFGGKGTGTNLYLTKTYVTQELLNISQNLARHSCEALCDVQISLLHGLLSSISTRKIHSPSRVSSCFTIRCGSGCISPFGARTMFYNTCRAWSVCAILSLADPPSPRWACWDWGGAVYLLLSDAPDRHCCIQKRAQNGRGMPLPDPTCIFCYPSFCYFPAGSVKWWKRVIRGEQEPKRASHIL